MYKITRHGISKKQEARCYRHWSFKVVVECDEQHPDADPNIFIFHTKPTNSINDEDPFAGVATLAQMSSVPIGESVEIEDAMSFVKNVPFYRMSTVTFDCPNAVEAERIWKVMKQRIYLLVHEFESAARLEPQEEIII